MPQGALKTKSGKGQAKNISKQKIKRAQRVRKGGRSIAPKKTKLVEALKMQKTFTKALKEQLEGELSAKATHVESKSFKVLQTAKNKKEAEEKERTTPSSNS